MSDNIDYDELDKAVSEAIKAKTAPKSSSKATTSVVKKTTTSSSRPVVKKTTAAPVSKPVVRRGAFMDFVQRPTAQPAVKPVTVAKPAVRPTQPIARPAMPATKPIAARPVAQNRPTPAPAAPVRVVTHAQSTHTVPQMRPAARPVAQSVAYQIEQQRILAEERAKALAAKRAEIEALRAEKERLERAKAERLAMEKAKAEAAALKAAEEQKAKEPNNNNYSIGSRSPFFVDTKVEKRPLGKNIPETNLDKLESTKNVYSKKSPTKAVRKERKHLVTDSPKQKSGWLQTLFVLGAVALGAALGYAIYFFVFLNGQ